MKNIYLEIIRGFAALFVFIHHILMFFPIASGNPLFKFIGAWGHQAVIVFFILSGVVIALSQEYKPKTAVIFLKNRFMRIAPIYWFAVLFSIALIYLVVKSDYPSYKNILSAFLFLGYTNTLVNNGPIWSITYEMLFYYMFALTINKYHKVLINGWILIGFGFLIISLYTPDIDTDSIVGVMTYSLIWLLGYRLPHLAKNIDFSFREALFSFLLILPLSRIDAWGHNFGVVNDLLSALIACPLFIYALVKTETKVLDKMQKNKLYYLLPLYAILIGLLFQYSNASISNKFIYALIPGLFLIISYIPGSALLDRLLEISKKTGVFLGSISFSLYIIHFPILSAASILIKNQMIGIITGIVLTGIISIFLEKKYQLFIMKKIFHK